MSELPTLLIVDDLAENLVAFTVILEGPDRRVLVARSATEALEHLLKEEVALALIDVQMPEIDGFGLAELMRSSRLTRHIPIVFVTAGHHDLQRVFEGYDRGAVDFLAKPVESRILCGKVDVFLELWRQKRQIAMHAAELEAVLAAVPAAVFLIRDTAPDVVVGNRHAHELLRLPDQSEPIPQHLRPYRLIRGGQELPPEARPLQSVAADGAPLLGYEMEVEFDDGERLHLYGNTAPLRGSDGRLRGAVGAFVDMTRIKDAEARLREADRRKDEFLAKLSHELRNPLMPIINCVQVLRRAPGSDAARRALDVIDRQSHHLARLVEDLLDLTRISNGKVQLRLQAVELVAALRAVADDHEEVFAAAGVALTVDLSEPPVMVEADPARLTQVMGNLLSNAAKFTLRGGHARLGMTHGETSARIEVADDGAGMGAETLRLLFRPFVQADQTLDRSLGGLGLGLVVVKSLVEMQRGTIEARSDGAGRGAAFTIEWPLHGAASSASIAPAAAESPRAEQGAARAPRQRVLLVEDNVDGAAMLAESIRLLGHHVAVVHEGAGAVAAARAFQPHVVFCDIGLPDIDGYEVAAALRRDAQCHGIRLVALSGYATSRDRDRALAAGFEHHMAKPPRLALVQWLIESAGTPVASQVGADGADAFA